MDDKELNKTEYENYSKEDGRILQDIIVTNEKVEKMNHSVCDYCGEENQLEYNYCKICGEKFYKITKDKGKNNSKLKIDKILKNLSIPKVILTSISGVVISLLMSFIVYRIMYLNKSEIVNIINPMHILLGMNLGVLDIYSSNVMSSSSLSLNLGIIIFTICPIISIIISNKIFMKKGINSAKNLMLSAICVGVTYGIILGIISVFTRVGRNPYDMLQYGYVVEYGYRYSSVLLNGFLIGIISILLSGYKNNFYTDNKVLYMIKLSLKTIITGFLIVFVILVILTISNSSYLHELGIYKYVSDLPILLVLSQLAIYMWAFANLIPVTIGKITVSVFSIGSSSLFYDTKLVFFAMISLSTLLILMNGIKLKSKYKEDKLKSVLYFSIAYSIFMTIIAFISSIIVNGNSPIIMGFEPIFAMITSFVYSFIVSAIGYKLS
ncbi:MAG: zinc ribbon domain-containing protein [Romboutsia sp.]